MNTDHQPFSRTAVIADHGGKIVDPYFAKRTLHEEFVTTKEILTIIEEDGNWSVQVDSKNGKCTSYFPFSTHEEAKAWCESRCDADAENQQEAK